MSSQHRHEPKPRRDGIEPYPLTSQQYRMVFKDKRRVEELSKEDLPIFIEACDQMIYYYRGGGGKRQRLRRRWVEYKERAETQFSLTTDEPEIL